MARTKIKPALILCICTFFDTRERGLAVDLEFEEFAFVATEGLLLLREGLFFDFCRLISSTSPPWNLTRPLSLSLAIVFNG